MNKHIRYSLFLLVAYWLFLPRLVYSDILLGVHPYLEDQTIIKRFSPLAIYLSVHLEQKVSVRVGRDYDAHSQAIGRDELDIAYLGPASYVKMVSKYNKKPLLARLEAKGKPTFSGHIVVNADSNINKIKDLKRKYFAFGDKNSTMSSLVPQAILKQHGVLLDDLAGYRRYKGHKNVALAVLSGDVDAGAVKEEVYEQYKNKGIRSLVQTPLISEHVFVTRSNMDPDLVDKIKQLLLNIKTHNKISRLLKPIKKSLTGLVTVKDEDYDSLRELMDLE